MADCHLSELITLHHRLDTEVEHDPTAFISDWNGTHPFVDQYLGRLNREALVLPGRYSFFNEEHGLINKIKSFHLKRDQSAELHENQIIGGEGSSSLLAAFSLWLCQRGIQEVIYIPPLYYALHFMLKLLRIRARPISGKHLFDPRARLALPTKMAVLLLCDPIWYAGRQVPMSYMREIQDWQSATDSLVFVDGSFQYMSWQPNKPEHSSHLDPNLTFRLICPTKSLAIPSYRFAYVILPRRFYQQFVFICECFSGSAALSNIHFAYRAMDVLNSKRGNGRLTSYLAGLYEHLISDGLIRTEIKPECGYFAFGIPTGLSFKPIVMTQDYFEQKRYPGYARINLMVAERLCRPNV